ncbi:MAG: AAA family ATPase, partial [Candidatus Acidiferrales bacterium]
MLRLRQVEIFGFKSFAERTRIVFGGSGVAAVVGPNGCGKSNIADSILWVLGEQSAKTLRRGRMADCIFNGTATRPPTNLAEVTLTLYDPESENAPEVPSSQPEAVPEAPVPDADPAAEDLASDESSRVTGHGPQVTAPETADESPAAPKRRKKALNLRILPGEVVVTRRLYRDGTSEYYLNGELCQLRDIQELFMGTGLGPESYAIIEEAAGVSKYKTKRRLAEAKLEASKINLSRVNDIH